MNIGIFTFGVFVTVLLVVGFIFTMNEFKKMGENPGDYKSKEAYKKKH